MEVGGLAGGKFVEGEDCVSDEVPDFGVGLVVAQGHCECVGEEECDC